MWTIYLCDENETILELLREKIVSCVGEYVAKIEIFKNTETLLDYLILRNVSGGVVFLPNDKNGISCGVKINEKYPDLQIIFLSDEDKYNLKVYEVRHLYLLKKPVHIEKLQTALLLAFEELKKRQNHYIMITHNRQIQNIEIQQITYAEANCRKIRIVTGKGEFFYYGKMKEFESWVQAFPFARTHKSFIVNLTKIRGIKKKFVIMQEEQEIPISQTYQKNFRERYMMFLEGKL